MTTDTQHCPSCGNAATGKFCNNCGAPLVGSNCGSCGTDVAAGARFCHLCGAPQGRRRPMGEGVMLARVGWGVAGVAVLALFVVLAIRLPGVASSSTAPPAGAAPFATRPAPDISNMTPRERADSLFNRIMREYEGGNQSRVDFFRPMALQAYALLGPLDPDARYHVGLIETVGGDLQAAQAQVDSIHTDSPDHLMGFMLQAAVARLRDDEAALQRAYGQFLLAFDDEMAENRREYTEHGQALEAFRAEARRSTTEGS